MVSVWSSMILHLILNASPSRSFAFCRRSFSLRKFSIWASRWPRCWAREDPEKQSHRDQTWEDGRICLRPPNWTACETGDDGTNRKGRYHRRTGWRRGRATERPPGTWAVVWEAKGTAEDSQVTQPRQIEALSAPPRVTKEQCSAGPTLALCHG